MLYMDHGVNIDRYPAVKDHLEQYRSELEGRATEQEWYELQQPQSAYRDYFEGSKILYPEIALEPRFAHHSGPLYPNNKCFFIPQGDYELLAVLNSKLAHFYLAQTCSTLGNPSDRGRIEFRAQHLKDLPIGIDPDGEGRLENELRELAKVISEAKNRRASLNLSLLDYLGNYTEGPKLPDMGLFQPTSSNILDATTEEYEKLQVENVRTKRDGQSVRIEGTARYKPEDEDEFETDTWGYTETDYSEAFTLTDLTDEEATLVEAFVPVAVEEEIGGFRDNATKTTSLIDRLKDITLPKIDNVQDDLQRYTETKERAGDLDEEIEKTDRHINKIVYDLYELTEGEVEIVEETVNSDKV